MASVIRVSILGTMPGGEVWSVNPCFFLENEPTEITGSEALTIATAIDAIVVPTGIRAWMNTSTFVTGVRVEARDHQGLLEAQAEHTKGTAIVGTGTQSHPYQTSTVTSLRTVTAGARGRGRLYWPATGAVVIPSTLRMDSTILGQGLTGVRTYLAAFETAIATTAGPNSLAVWSRTTPGGAFHAVVNIRQGDVLDTQRRRRDALAESYTELTFPT